MCPLQEVFYHLEKKTIRVHSARKYYFSLSIAKFQILFNILFFVQWVSKCVQYNKADDFHALADIKI